MTLPQQVSNDINLPFRKRKLERYSDRTRDYGANQKRQFASTNKTTPLHALLAISLKHTVNDR
ncbi:hypothetical protein [Rosenbergiella gaditana]|uniref:hypothetical protein n=1 Tax=Rosenbergiella gaditana TaxID=2726987 RepID=UPI001BDA7F39|nr:hypothetical protein [Rosenbergiella gaditana]